MDAIIRSLTERKKDWLMGLASVVAGVSLLIVYFQSGPDAKAYASAESAMATWGASPQDEKLYDSMRRILQKVPEIGKKYEAEIAQNLINTQKIDEALVMAGRSLNRVKDEIPFHAMYAKTSLLIEKKNYQQALESAVALKEQMGDQFLKEPKPGSLLYAHNLLRIACLQQALQNMPGEKAAWEELEPVLDASSPLSEEILVGFSTKHIDLRKYIAERKKWL